MGFSGRHWLPFVGFGAALAIEGGLVGEGSVSSNQYSPVSVARPAAHSLRVLGPPFPSSFLRSLAAQFIAHPGRHSSRAWWGKTFALVELAGHSSRCCGRETRWLCR